MKTMDNADERSLKPHARLDLILLGIAFVAPVFWLNIGFRLYR